MLPCEPGNYLMVVDSFEQNRFYWQLPNPKELNLNFSLKLRPGSAVAYHAPEVPAAL